MTSGGAGRVVIEWIDSAQTRHLQPPQRLGRERIEDGLPIRQYAHYKGSLAKPGLFYMASVSRHVPYESKLEAWCLLDLDFSGECEAILPQPCRLHFGTGQPPYRHVPDFLFRSKSGGRVLLDVKGALAAKRPLNAATFALTRAICDDLGWEFRLAHEPDPIYFQNLRFLASTRSPAAAEALDVYAHAISSLVADHDDITWGAIAYLLAADVPPHLLPRAIARCLWTRSVTTDLTRALSDDSVIVVADGAGQLGVAS